MSDEYFDILNEQGELTGEKRPRGEAHSLGLWHRTVHIYVLREKEGQREFLVHLRAKSKDLNPDKWDTRFGGHLRAGETFEEAVVAELEEEIGLKVKLGELIKGPLIKRDLGNNKEFTQVYFYNFRGDAGSLKFKDGEVQEVKWMGQEDLTASMVKEPDIWTQNALGDFQFIIQKLI